ncbi:hypothetical protein FLAG1_10067 [Fusarium langsethiae]|uniref:Uncharacterized protein n=1 Tax=Fusarium langsethiae TaxID=179993 RepID=A0A0M9EPU2_FUSLA|nr:hypothetical protein FLAG1_10067 [Fusarium langsethiae]
MESLHSVTFDIDLPGESTTFARLFISRDKWVSPRSVVFHRANVNVFKAIIKNFGPGTLQAVQLPVESENTHYSVLKSQRSSLQALHIDVKLRYGTRGIHQFPSMKPDYLKSIMEDFPQLTSLIIDDRSHGYIRASDSFYGEIDQKAEALAKTLGLMTGLRQFSFGLQDNQVYGCVNRQRGGVVRDDSFPTTADLDSWCFMLLRECFIKVPHLEEMCILKRNHGYRGDHLYKAVRNGNTRDIEAISFEDTKEEGKFPSVLTG